MKQLYTLFLLMAVAMAVLLAGCGGGGGGAPTTGTISGMIQKADFSPLSGVAVSVGNSRASINSDNDGKFTITGVAPGTAVLTLTKNGYIQTQRSVTIQAGVVSQVVCMLPVLTTDATVDISATPKTVVDNGRTDGNSGEVILAANSVKNGNTNVTAVNVAITTALTKDNNYERIFPGSFTGIPATGGAAVPIESFGFIDVTLTDATGNELQLNPELPATIRIPVDPVLAGALPNEIELWSLNETTGIWEQVKLAGVGVKAVKQTVGGKVYFEAQVTHFSPYNLDRPIIAPGQLTFTAKFFGSGAPAPGAHIVVKTYDATTGSLWQADGITNASGIFAVTLPQSGNPNISATYNGDYVNPGAITGVGVNRQCALTVPGAATTSVTFTVKDKNDVAVAGAIVEVIAEHQAGGGAPVTFTSPPTNNNGITTVTGIKYSPWFMINVKKDNVVIGYDNLSPVDTTKTITLTNYPTP